MVSIHDGSNSYSDTDVFVIESYSDDDSIEGFGNEKDMSESS